MSNYIYHYDSPVGQLTLASDGESITGLWLAEQKYFAKGLDASCKEQSLPVFERAADWLDLYFKGKRPTLAVPLQPSGSAFRLAVWQLLREIPYGEVTTYGDIARHISAATGRIASARAVGGAVGHNPISILIPCHRVIGANGSLTGYAGGIENKIKLLELEKALV